MMPSKLQLAALEVVLWATYWGFVGLFYCIMLALIDSIHAAVLLAAFDIVIVAAVFFVAISVLVLGYVRETLGG